MVRVLLVLCFVALNFVGSASFARADDEPQASKFVLDFSTIELESGVQLEREKSDLALLLNVILACDLDVPDGPADLSPENWKTIHTECSPKVTQWSSHTVTRWGGNIAFFIDSSSKILNDDTSVDAVFILEMLGRLSSKLGVEFEPSLWRPSAKLVFDFLSEDDKQWERDQIEAGKTAPHLRELIAPLLEGRGSACVSSFRLAPPGDIEKFVLSVDATRPLLERQRCIADAIVRLMGLQVGYQIQPAIGITVQRSSPPIYLIGVLPDGLRSLELLYEDWLVPGMNVEQVVAAARQNLDLQVVAD